MNDLSPLVNDEAKIKAVLAASFFIISMVIVGSIAFEAGYQEGYAQADQDWRDFLNESLAPFVDMIYREGYIKGYVDGYLWGWVEAWNKWGNDSVFCYPEIGTVP